METIDIQYTLTKLAEIEAHDHMRLHDQDERAIITDNEEAFKEAVKMKLGGPVILRLSEERRAELTKIFKTAAILCPPSPHASHTHMSAEAKISPVGLETVHEYIESKNPDTTINKSKQAQALNQAKREIEGLCTLFHDVTKIPRFDMTLYRDLKVRNAKLYKDTHTHGAALNGSFIESGLFWEAANKEKIYGEAGDITYIPAGLEHGTKKGEIPPHLTIVILDNEGQHLG